MTKSKITSLFYAIAYFMLAIAIYSNNKDKIGYIRNISLLPIIFAFGISVTHIYIVYTGKQINKKIMTLIIISYFLSYFIYLLILNKNIIASLLLFVSKKINNL